MGWKEREDSSNFIRFSKEKDEIIGRLKKVEESANYEGVNVYTFEIESAVEGGTALKDFSDSVFPKGEARLFGSTVLDRKMEGIKLGTKVKIVYLGKTISTKKGKAKNYKVYEEEK